MIAQGLYVANIPPDITNEELHEFFSQFGTVESAAVLLDNKTKERRNVARLVMEVETFSPELPKRLTGNMLEDHFLFVSLSKPPDKFSKPTEEDKRQAAEVAEMLNETEYQPRTQLTRLVHHCGMPFVLQLIEEAKEIEANGGLMVLDGSRRRTFGGVFFFVARVRMSHRMQRSIFYMPGYNQKQNQNQNKGKFKGKGKPKGRPPKGKGKPTKGKPSPSGSGQPASRRGTPQASGGPAPEAARKQYAQLRVSLRAAQQKLEDLKSMPPAERKSGLFSATREVVNIQKQIAMLKKQYTDID